DGARGRRRGALPGRRPRGARGGLRQRRDPKAPWLGGPAPGGGRGGGGARAATRGNLAWVRPNLAADGGPEDELLLLADAQTSGGLLIAGELPGHPVIGELVPARAGVTLLVR